MILNKSRYQTFNLPRSTLATLRLDSWQASTASSEPGTYHRTENSDRLAQRRLRSPEFLPGPITNLPNLRQRPIFFLQATVLTSSFGTMAALRPSPRFAERLMLRTRLASSSSPRFVTLPLSQRCSARFYSSDEPPPPPLLQKLKGDLKSASTSPPPASQPFLAPEWRSIG